MKEELVKLLEQLVTLKGVSGFEQEVVKAIVSIMGPYADEIEVDDFGNIYAVKRGRCEGPRLMLVAHSDEVGAIINEVLPNGMLRFKLIGVLSNLTLPATMVKVGNITGVIGCIPAHLENSNTDRRLDLHIDIGASSAEEVISMGIDIGTPVSFLGDLVPLGNPDRVCGHAVDNRIGCALIIQLFKELASSDFVGTLYGVFTVQEETTMTGARIAAGRVLPDCAIAVDTVPADDTSNVLAPKFTIGGGPVIQLAEGVQRAYVGTIAHPSVKRAILEAAHNENIKVQLAAEISHWTTDAAAIHSVGKGIPTGFISIPRRYAHSQTEVLDVNDAVLAVRLLERVVKDLEHLKISFFEN